MKTILAISDSHGDKNDVLKVVADEKHDYLFFMGDGLRDIEDLTETNVIKVAGNCDIFFNFEAEVETLTIENVRVLITHGHRYKVKYSLALIEKEARERGINLVCFGHTHAPLVQLIDGITYVNPGSLKDGNYAVITVDGNKITATLKRLD